MFDLILTLIIVFGIIIYLFYCLFKAEKL
ncbi:MAG: potassium-transporting ATPase subunit F [Candidatus Humimicrobiaceae bacterium]